MKRLLATFVLFATTLVLSAKPHTPAVGSAERKAICDAMRGHVAARTKMPLAQTFLFKIEFLKVEGNYAAFEGFPVKADGSDFSPEVFGDQVFMTFLKKDSNGAWKVVSDLTRSDVPSAEELREIRMKFPADFPAAVMPDFWRQLLRP